ncbi:hypothetical protein MSG28_015660 [Choristoneura fumiferana]|uniref:Uncharacterized protein n=1 Tax=Choristoneura fumiferana TaxID=7141 RepID=A0ACC0KB02_CHOFU|nr:hypothetical protein MSG28_015660 [Choristoneura fumiferana]
MANYEGMDFLNNTSTSTSEPFKNTYLIQIPEVLKNFKSHVDIPSEYPGVIASKTDDFCTSHAATYLNVTCQIPIDYALVMYGYIAPFLLVLTVVANTLIVAVLSRPHMRSPTNVILMAMALCDMLTTLFPAPWNFYMYTLGNHYKPLGPVAICTTWKYMTHGIPHLFHTASVWMTLALAVHQYICVCHTPLARTWHNTCLERDLSLLEPPPTLKAPTMDKKNATFEDMQDKDFGPQA